MKHTLRLTFRHGYGWRITSTDPETPDLAMISFESGMRMLSEAAGGGDVVVALVAVDV